MSEPRDRHDFDGAVAVVTGAAGGIGRAIVTALGERGARTAALDLSTPTIGDLRLECDVTDEAAVSKAVDQTVRGLGPIGLLVCAAGVVSESPVAELSVDEWHRVIDISLLGSFLMARAVLPSMRGLGSGHIVAFSSGYATKGYARGAHYAAAKAGVEGFVKSLALEVAEDAITVNAVAPGPVATKMLDHLEPARRSALETAIPLGRIAETQDVVPAVLFLLSDAAGYVTGQVLHVNGGSLMP